MIGKSEAVKSFHFLAEEPPSSIGKVFWSFYKPYKLSVIALTLCASIVGIYGLLNAFFTKILIDVLNDSPINNKIVLAFSIVVVMNFEMHNICWRVINYINLRIVPVIKNHLIQGLFDRVHHQSERFFQETLGGAIANNIMIMAENFERIGSNLSIRLIRSAAQLIAALITMYCIHPIFSMALLIWTLCFVLTSLRFSKKISNLANDLATAQSHVAGRVVDSITNFSSVKLFVRRVFEGTFIKKSLNLMTEMFQKKERFLIKFYFFQGFSITCLVGFIIYFLIRFKISDLITVGDFAFILGSTLYVTENVWSGTELIDQLNEAWGKCRHSLKVIFSPVEVVDKKNAPPLKVKAGKIVFDRVGFHYTPDRPFFINKSLTIHSGQKVGVVGYSGSGKSTFINLLLRLYDVTHGQILVDGQNIQSVDQNTLRSCIGLIPQNPSLFHRTLMDNIRFGRVSASDEEVIEAAKKAHVHEFALQLPRGYHSLIGEQGVKLSGGERQRVAIARVLLKNAPLLILDEATSQLDAVTEKAIKETLFEVMKEKTTLIIAHRLSTLLNMDRILVFDNGKIIEDGSHEDLLNKNGHYKSLWDAQIGGFLPSVQSKCMTK